MRRSVLYQRTKGYSIYGTTSFIYFVSCFFLVAVITVKDDPTCLWQAVGWLSFLCSVAVLILFLCYRRYWLDLFKREVAVFEGEVYSYGHVPGSVMETGWKNWKLIEKGNDTSEPFFICLRQMEAQYKNTMLLQDLCCGPCSFLYLKRTRCIVEIMKHSKPELDTRSKHAKKKARRKAQYLQQGKADFIITRKK